MFMGSFYCHKQQQGSQLRSRRKLFQCSVILKRGFVRAYSNLYFRQFKLFLTKTPKMYLMYLEIKSRILSKLKSGPQRVRFLVRSWETDEALHYSNQKQDNSDKKSQTWIIDNHSWKQLVSLAGLTACQSMFGKTTEIKQTKTPGPICKKTNLETIRISLTMM